MAETSESVREIGIPVRGVNWVRLFAGQTQSGADCLYATMGQESAPLFVLQIDPADGSLRQFDAPVLPATDVQSNSCPASFLARNGRLYVGAAYSGHLLCFDPVADELRDLGAIHPEAATFPCRIDADADGGIWIGSYPTADLTRFDPSTGAFEHVGPMDDVDMYNYPLANVDGTVANLIRVTRSFVVVYDPITGEKRQVGPVAVQGEDSLDLWRAADGRLVIESTLGHFIVDGLDAVPIDELPSREKAATLPDGSRFSFADAAQQSHTQLQIQRPDAELAIHELSYDASGSRIFTVHEGPDGCIYGSSVMPLHLFRWDPESDVVKDLGPCSSATGEAYSMANFDGRLYIASYPQAKLSVYDPSRPYNFGDGEQDNPRDLGRIDELSYRPRTTLAGPLNRLWFASVPDYGKWGGPLSWYEPATGARGSYGDIAGDGSCYTLAWLDRQQLLAVGLTIEGGTGTKPKLDNAGLVLWDVARETTVWQGGLPGSDPVLCVNSLIATDDGALVGVARRQSSDDDASPTAELFRFDPVSRSFTDQVALPHDTPDHCLQVAPDGTIFGFTYRCLFHCTTDPFGVDVILQDDDADEDRPFRVAGPVRQTADGGQEILFARTHRLMAIRL